MHLSKYNVNAEEFATKYNLAIEAEKDASFLDETGSR